MSPRRLYLDNSATSFPKPRAVIDAMTRYASELGASAGRGAYREAVETGDLIAQCRRRLNTLFNGERPEHFIFTLNCTEALNLAIKGVIDPRASETPHAICTAIDHNSILRPLSAMAEAGWIDYSSGQGAQLTAAGVKRISLATSLYRAAMTGLLAAAREVKDKGTFGYVDTSVPTPELNAFLE